MEKLKVYLCFSCIDEGISQFKSISANSLEDAVKKDMNSKYPIFETEYEGSNVSEAVEEIKESQIDGDSEAGFVIIDITDPKNPIPVFSHRGTFKLVNGVFDIDWEYYQKYKNVNWR